MRLQKVGDSNFLFLIFCSLLAGSTLLSCFLLSLRGRGEVYNLLVVWCQGLCVRQMNWLAPIA
jgi:hypothetical protein